MTENPGTDQFQNYLNQAQIKIRNNKFYEWDSSQCAWSEVLSPQSYPFSIKYFFKKVLLNEKNPHSLIFMRGTANKSQLLHSFTLKKQNLKETRRSPL